MAVIDYMNVVMAADTKELDAGVARAIKDIDRVKSAASGSSVDVKGFKDISKNTKSTAEFAGVLGSLAGESALGQLGQMIGGISEKVSQFSEISQAGSAGALAFKAGLVGLVAAGSFNVGTMIGEWWFETKRWNEELKNSAERLKQIGSQTRSIQEAGFRDEMANLDLLDPSSRMDEVARMWNQSNKDLDALSIRRDQAAPGAEKNELQEQLNLLNRKRAVLWAELDPRKAKLRAMEEEKEKEREQAAIRKAANDELGKLARRYDELTLGKDAARAKEMKELGLSEGAIGREENLRRMVDEQEKIAAKLKEDQAEANRLKKDSLTLEEQAVSRAKELARLKSQGLITQLEFDRQLEKVAKETRKDQPEYRGAVSAQAGSVEAYKLLLERDKGAINEAMKQTAHLDRLAQLMQEVANNTKGGKVLLAAR